MATVLGNCWGLRARGNCSETRASVRRLSLMVATSILSHESPLKTPRIRGRVLPATRKSRLAVSFPSLPILPPKSPDRRLRPLERNGSPRNTTNAGGCSILIPSATGPRKPRCRWWGPCHRPSRPGKGSWIGASRFAGPSSWPACCWPMIVAPLPRGPPPRDRPRNAGKTISCRSASHPRRAQIPRPRGGRPQPLFIIEDAQRALA